MKQVLIYLLLGVSILGNAQDSNDWQIGANANPFIFRRFRPSELPVRLKQDFPNGFATGITLEKSINDKWSIETGVNYSWQNDKYGVFNSDDVNIGNILYKFNYFKIPLIVSYKIDLKNNYNFIIFQGVQHSNLSKYYVRNESRIQILTMSNGFATGITKETGDYFENFYGDWMFKKQTYGLIGGFGVKKQINNKISLSAKLIYDYDLTDGQRIDVYDSWGTESYNFRIGLDFGMQFHFSLKNNRQSKCP